MKITFENQCTGALYKTQIDSSDFYGYLDIWFPKGINLVRRKTEALQLLQIKKERQGKYNV